MFSVKLVARPDARMVEVPLEIEAELPREFEGAALLAASGLPRKVKIKAGKDALKLSTAYRTDQLVADIVKSALRGTALDVQRVQEAVTKFIRTVRERRQDGATLLVSSNGRGKVDVAEQLPQGARATAAAPAEPPRSSEAAPASALERRLADLEARVASLQAQLGQPPAGTGGAGPGMEAKPGAQASGRTGATTRRPTAVEAYAEGLRRELVANAAAACGRAGADTERCDKAAALAAEAELLGAPAEGTAQRLRDASAQAAARQNALERLAQEIEFYANGDLPVAAQLLHRLEHSSAAPDPAGSLETVAQAVVRAARGGDSTPRAAWLKRAAALCGWQLVEPARGEPADPEWHQVVDSGGSAIVRVACPGLKRADGSGIVRARVHVDPAVASLPEEPGEPGEAMPEPIPAPISVPPPAPSAQRPLLDGPSAAAGAREAGTPPAETVAQSRARAAAALADSFTAAARSGAGANDASAEAEASADAATAEAEHEVEAEAEAARASAGSPPAARTHPFGAPFGDLAGADEIHPNEAATAAQAASRVPRIVPDDRAQTDDALAAEIALAVETETSIDGEWAKAARGPAAYAQQPAGPDEVEAEGDEVLTAGDEDVVEVQELTELLPEDDDPSAR